MDCHTISIPLPFCMIDFMNDPLLRIQELQTLSYLLIPFKLYRHLKQITERYTTQWFRFCNERFENQLK